EPSGSGVTTAQAVAPGAPLPPTGPREEAPAPESAPAIDSRLSDPLKRAAVDASGDSEPDAATNYGDGTSVPMPAAQPGPEAPASEATMRGEAGRALDVTQAATTGQAAELTAPAPASAASLAGYEP